MTTYTTQPALDFSLIELAYLFTRSFAGYFMPVNMTAPALALTWPSAGCCWLMESHPASG